MAEVPTQLTTDISLEKGCLGCHEGIEEIREPNSSILMQTKLIGQANGDPNGCITCNGGNPMGLTANESHQGSPKNLANGIGPKTFYPDPGSIWIADRTCGQCHVGYPYRLERGLMNTEAGKIQGNLHTWGIKEVQNYKVPWGNYDVNDKDGLVPMVGTQAYKDYMVAMIDAHPDQYPIELKQMPLPTVDEIEADPKLAGFTYQRQQCQRCHVGVKGREKRGDYRGMGCSAFHIPYSNEGYYEGGDPNINKEEKGHMLVHRIQGTRGKGCSFRERVFRNSSGVL